MRLANISFNTKLFEKTINNFTGDTVVRIHHARQSTIEWTVATKDFKHKHTICKLKRGVYIATLNFDHFINSFCKSHVIDKDFCSNNLDFSFDSFGVCDNVDQAMEYGRKRFKGIDHECVLRLYPVIKTEQHPVGGWRWRKWGDYIGTQTPTTEYIYDEPNIEMVFCFKFEPVMTRDPDCWLNDDRDGDILSILLP